MAPDGIAGSGFKDRANERACDFRREDDGDALRGNVAGAEAANGAACGLLAHIFRRFEKRETARAGPPAVALHGAVGVHGEGSG